MTSATIIANLVRDSASLAERALFDARAGQLCTAEIARNWLSERLAAVVADGEGLPAGYADAVLQSLVMFDDGRVQLSLAFVDADNWRRQRESKQGRPDVIGFADGWTRIVFLAAPDVRVQRFTFDGNIARPHTPSPVATGAVIDLCNERDALRFWDMADDIVMLRLLVRDPGVAVATECDAATGAVLRTRQAQSHDGRTQMMVSLLRSLGKAEAVPVIAGAIGSWPPHLRWHGVREAVALDSAAGTAMLATMAALDPDPGLRALAGRTRAELVARHPMLAELA